MKTLERQFFKFCCKNIDHNCNDITSLTFRKMDIEDRSIPINAIELYRSGNQEQNYNFVDLIKKYVIINPKVSIKQLCYYVEKWERYGFIDYGVSIYYGLFDFSKLPFEYFIIIPCRLFSLCKAFKFDNLTNYYYIKEYIKLSRDIKELKRKRKDDF